MRKVYILPNLVTTANLAAGFYSITAAIQGEFVTASWAILAATVFDMLDGRIARMAKATSKFGVEYDSLSDVLSFGMAPAVLLHQWQLAPFGRLGWLASFLFVACAALRLARFNVTLDRAPKNYFQGLATPGAAGLVAAFVIFQAENMWPMDPSLMTLILTFGLSSLMVSTIPFPSFKELNWRSRATFGYLMVGVLTMILIAARPEVTLFIGGSAYVVFSLIWSLFRGRKVKAIESSTQPQVK